MFYHLYNSQKKANKQFHVDPMWSEPAFSTEPANLQEKWVWKIAYRPNPNQNPNYIYIAALPALVIFSG